MYTNINKLHTQVYTKHVNSTKQIEARLDTSEQGENNKTLNSSVIFTEKGKHEY